MYMEFLLSDLLVSIKIDFIYQPFTFHFHLSMLIKNKPKARKKAHDRGNLISVTLLAHLILILSEKRKFCV